MKSSTLGSRYVKARSMAKDIRKAIREGEKYPKFNAADIFPYVIDENGVVHDSRKIPRRPITRPHVIIDLPLNGIKEIKGITLFDLEDKICVTDIGPVIPVNTKLPGNLEFRLTLTIQPRETYPDE